jgi:2-polyprenyl-6-hydroxyphenyl methylase/3-demethylubiquinone-9 3-methyltransferase
MEQPMVPSSSATTASSDEVARFQALADQWWNADGTFKPLHQLNPTRLAFLRDRLASHFGRDALAERPFAGLTLLDVGCGGGLLSEPLARLGFTVTGIDAGDQAIGVARLHAEQSRLAIDYRCAAPEQVSGQFDVVTALEVVEHVPDAALFLAAVGDRLKLGGAFVGATLNRTAKSFALGIVAAEYLLSWVPRGTHRWRKFRTPAEFAGALRRAGIRPIAFEGVRYDPLHDRWERSPALDVNYMVYGAKR